MYSRQTVYSIFIGVPVISEIATIETKFVKPPESHPPHVVM